MKSFHLTANADYTSVNRTITFPRDMNMVTVPVPISADGIMEANENFTVLISMSSEDQQVGIDDGEALVTIVDISKFKFEVRC